MFDAVDTYDTNATIVGPYFFEENGITVTVNSDRYINNDQQFSWTRTEEKAYQ